MSLSSICRRVLSMNGWPVLGSIASNTEATAQQVFSLANLELEQLSQKYKWPHLMVEYDFPTVAAQTVYPWPEDFRIPEPDAIFSSDDYYRLRGSTQYQYWQLFKYGKLGSLNRKRFRQIYSDNAPSIELSPAPVGVEQLTSLYYSKYFARDEDGNDIPEYALDSDVSRIPEDLIQLGLNWRFRNAKGLDFGVALSEYNTVVAQRFAQFTAQGESSVGSRRPTDLDGLTYGYVPDQGFGL